MKRFIMALVLVLFALVAFAPQAYADGVTLSISLDAAMTPSSRIVVPGSGPLPKFAALRLEAAGGDVWLTHVPLELTAGAPSDVEYVSVYNGADLAGGGRFESSTLQVFLSRTVFVPRDGQVTLSVYAEIAAAAANGTRVAINFDGDAQSVAYDIRGNLVSVQGGDTNAPGVHAMSSYPTFAPLPLGDTDDGDGDDGSSSRVSLRTARRIMGDNLIGPRFPRQWGIRLSPRERRLLKKVPFSRGELKSKRYTHFLIAGRSLTRAHVYNWMVGRDLLGVLPTGDLGTEPSGDPWQEIKPTWYLVPVDRAIPESRLSAMNVAEKGYCNLVFYYATGRAFFTDEELQDPLGAGPPPAGRFFPGRELGRWSITANGGFLTAHQFTFKVARAAVPDPLGISVANLRVLASDTPDFVNETQFGGTIAALPSDNDAEIAIWSVSSAPEAQAPESVRYFRLAGDVTLTSGVGAIATQLLGDGAYPALQTQMGTVTELLVDPWHRFLWAPGISAPEDRNWTNGFIVPGLPADDLSWNTLLE